MRRQATAVLDRRGVSVVDEIVSDELSWHFREQPILDFGVDAHVEVVTDDDLVTGRNIGLQIKSGSSYFKRLRPTRDGWTFSCDNDHLAYWLGHSLPLVVVIVDTDKKAYWQVVTPDTVAEKPKSFTLFIPKSQRFDASAKRRLLEIAGRSGGVLEALPQRYAQLPPPVAHALRRAADLDRLATARLAERFTRGSDLTEMTVASLVAAQPTWLVLSPAAQNLWLAVAAYAAAHQHKFLGAEAYLLAAEAGGAQSARARALAGLGLLYDGDRDRSPDLLRRARAEGAVLLADMGLIALALPERDARAFEIPQSIRDATHEQIDAEPAVWNFLSEAAIRRGDLDKGIEYQERALACHGDDAGGTHLALAKAILRRESISSRPSARQWRRAVTHAHTAVEQRRRWNGPSAEALAWLLRIYLRTGEIDDAVTAALPVSRGGTAREHESRDPEVARLGVRAAHVAGNTEAVEFFLSPLPENAQTRLVRAEIQDITGLSRQERLTTWRALVAEADDDEMTAQCVSRLVYLGDWPAQADLLQQRSIVPPDGIAMFKAIYQARSGNRDGGLAALRQLARTYPAAAHALVEILAEDVSADAAIAESERQISRSQDPNLRLQLIDLLRGQGLREPAAQLAEKTINDAALATYLRLELCRRYVADKQQASDIAGATEFARVGLEIADDPQLAWALVSGLLEQGELAEARAALAQHRPQPVSDKEIRLWVHLRLGQPLSADDAQTMLELIDRLPDGRIRQGLITLLIRDVLVNGEHSTATYATDLVRQVETLAADRTGQEGILQVSLDDEDAIRAILEQRQPDPALAEQLIDGVRRGVTGLDELAAQTNLPYGAALVHRAAGVLFAADLAPGLRRTGEHAAHHALDAGLAVVDMSSLHLLNLLEPDDRLLLRDAIRDLCAPVGVVNDAIRTRDAVHTATTATQQLFLGADGRIERAALTVVQRARLREHAQLLENAVRGLRLLPVPEPARQSTDAIALATQLGIPLWCDDTRSRQRARVRNVATFGLLDLLTVLAGCGARIDTSRVLRRLAGQYVVDLPLEADDVAAVAAAEDWADGPAHILLHRTGWWRHHEQTWQHAFAGIAQAARAYSDTALTGVTKAALTGALQHVSPGLRTRRYQDLVVTALSACHAVDRPAPQTLLADLTSFTGQDLAPSPIFVVRALIRDLEQHAVADPVGVAQRLLPGAPLY